MINKRMALILVAVAAFAVSAVANPLPVITCGWEDPGTTVLGFYPADGSGQIVTNVTAPDPVYDGDRALRIEDTLGWGDIYVTTTGNFDIIRLEHLTKMKDQAIVCNIAPDPVYDGDRALRIEDTLPSGTPQAFVAFVYGLEDGDQVTAGFWRYDDTPDGSPSCRIWGHWNDELPDNPDGYSGSAGHLDYGTGTGWEWTEYTWTVVDGHTGLVIECRTYSSPGDTVWIDGLEIIPPEDCVVQTPCELVVGTESQTLTDVKSLFR